MTRLPDTLRTALADAVERILAPDVDLQALARGMDDATGAIRTRPWTRPQPAGLDQVIEVNRTLLPVTDHEPDLTLLTAGEGTPVYLRRWWLRRQLAGNGYGQDGLYVHVFDNDDPDGSTTTRGPPPHCCGPTAPSSRTPRTAPPSSRTAASCCARRRTGTGSASATGR